MCVPGYVVTDICLLGCEPGYLCANLNKFVEKYVYVNCVIGYASNYRGGCAHF